MRTHRAEVETQVKSQVKAQVKAPANAHIDDGHADDHDDAVWAEHARCAGVDPDVFFPVGGRNTGPAKAFCRACPVRTKCLEWALETQQKHGVWGGMTASQRRRLRRAQASAPVFDVDGLNGSVEVDQVPAVRVGRPRHLQLVR